MFTLSIGIIKSKGLVVQCLDKPLTKLTKETVCLSIGDLLHLFHDLFFKSITIIDLVPKSKETILEVRDQYFNRV